MINDIHHDVESANPCRKEDHAVCTDGRVTDYFVKWWGRTNEYNPHQRYLDEPHLNFILNSCAPKISHVGFKETRLRMTQTFNIGK